MAANLLLRPRLFPATMGAQKPCCYVSSRSKLRRSPAYSWFPLNHYHMLSLQRNPPPALLSKESDSPLSPCSTDTHLLHFYRIPFLQDSAASELIKNIQAKISPNIIDLQTEQCFNISLAGPSKLSPEKLDVLKWLLGETYQPQNLQTESFLQAELSKGAHAIILEVGPRMSFTTAWSTNAVSVCQSCGLTEVSRLERSRRYLLYLKPGTLLIPTQLAEFISMVHDRMTECVYPKKLDSFSTSAVPEPVQFVPVLERGSEALEEINIKMGLAFDEQDIKYYTILFRDDIKRNLTTVELFDIAQSNSEHSRHWFF